MRTLQHPGATNPRLAPPPACDARLGQRRAPRLPDALALAGVAFGAVPGLCVAFAVFDQLGLYGTAACAVSALACLGGTFALRRA